MRSLALALLLSACSAAPLAVFDAGPDLDAGEPQSDAGPPPGASVPDADERVLSADADADERVLSDDPYTGWCVPGDCYCGCLTHYCGALTCGDDGRWLLVQCVSYASRDGGAPPDADPRCTSSVRGICACVD